VILLPPSAITRSSRQIAGGGDSHRAHRAQIQFERHALIGIDDYAAARQVTGHLLDLGHRRIGFMLGRPEHGATEQRYLGFIDEMRAHEVAVDFDLVQTGNFLFSDGLQCAERMLSVATPPTAIFASNDDMAAAVISMARKFGLDLPAASRLPASTTRRLRPCCGPNSPPCGSRICHGPPCGGSHHPPRAAPQWLAGTDSRHLLKHELIVRSSTVARRQGCAGLVVAASGDDRTQALIECRDRLDQVYNVLAGPANRPSVRRTAAGRTKAPTPASKDNEASSRRPRKPSIRSYSRPSPGRRGGPP